MAINDDNTHLYNGFYIGTVVDNKDPLNSQRVKVRVLGLHTQKKNGNQGNSIPDADLPWANQCTGLINGTYIPKNGDNIYLFFLNGNHNEPVYIGKVRKANDTPFETDNLEKIGQARNEKTKELNDGAMQIKTAKTIHGSKVEVRNTESGAFIKLDSFNGKSRIVLSADIIEIDGDSRIGKGPKGYPLLSETKETAISIGGTRLRTSHSAIA